MCIFFCDALFTNVFFAVIFCFSLNDDTIGDVKHEYKRDRKCGQALR